MSCRFAVSGPPAALIQFAISRNLALGSGRGGSGSTASRLFTSSINNKNISSRPVPTGPLARPCVLLLKKEIDRLDEIKKAFGLDEEGKKRREAARKRVREEERRERADRVRQDAEAMKKDLR